MKSVTKILILMSFLIAPTHSAFATDPTNISIEELAADLEMIELARLELNEELVMEYVDLLLQEKFVKAEIASIRDIKLAIKKNDPEKWEIADRESIYKWNLELFLENLMSAPVEITVSLIAGAKAIKWTRNNRILRSSGYGAILLGTVFALSENQRLDQSEKISYLPNTYTSRIYQSCISNFRTEVEITSLNLMDIMLDYDEKLEHRKVLLSSIQESKKEIFAKYSANIDGDALDAGINHFLEEASMVYSAAWRLITERFDPERCDSSRFK
ncbi:MAG: hypothetical protein AB8E15_05295 [Bdellovibrionales bacterium]